MNVILDWLANGLWDFSPLALVAITLVLTHITIVAVTVYLHRYSAHRALELHPVVIQVEDEMTDEQLRRRGGEAEAAISMARQVRKDPVFTAVPVETRIPDGPQSVCYSACVVLSSAGYRRSL